HDRTDQARLALARERLPAGQHLVEDASEREEVAARVGLPALELLRRHVLERAEDRAASRERLALLKRRRHARGLGDDLLRRRLELGEAEVEQLHARLR